MAKISIPVEAGTQGDTERLPAESDAAKRRSGGSRRRCTSPRFDAKRAAFIVFDSAESAGIPLFAERLFVELNAEVQFSAVLNAGDIQKGRSGLA
jgi:hypothetical protein